MNSLSVKQVIRLCLVSGILAVFTIVCVQAAETEQRKLRRQLSLQAILGEKVMLNIEGERQLLALGQAAVAGVRVLRISADYVEVEVDGVPRRLELGASDAVTMPFKERQSVIVSIPRDDQGMYTTVGSINGQTVDFLVDTGATTISMNARHARRLGINFRFQGQLVQVGTASGVAQGYLLKLQSVGVGEITLRNVEAVVMEGDFPKEVLLGMSFLGRVEMQRDAAMLQLKKNF